MINSILITYTTVAVIMDLRRQKIDNHWIIAGWFLGLIYQLYDNRLTGLMNYLCGCLMPIFLLYVLFLFRMTGAGDIKLLSVLGGFMGPGRVTECIAYSLLFGAICSLMILILCGNLLSRLRYFTDYLRDFLKTKKAVPYMVRGQRMENFHFTVPVLMAVLLYTGGVY